jgi:hypothetical protein
MMKVKFHDVRFKVKKYIRLVEDKNDIIKRATIASNGELTEKYTYLKDYAS